MRKVPSILSIQDMSSVGRCSLTVMIPLVSALQCQAIPLATAVLCNHLEYDHFEITDLTHTIEPFMACWKKNNISFDAIQSGFLASPEQIDLVIQAIQRFGYSPTGERKLIVVDPAMADDGKLYSIYTDTMVDRMRQLIKEATIIKPNYTEACFLLNRPYSNCIVDDDSIISMCEELHAMGPTYIVLSSIPSNTHAKIAVYNGIKKAVTWVQTPLIPVKAHGTGDTFTAIMTALILRNYTPEEASEIAAQFTTEAIQTTLDQVGSLKDGLALELLLHKLVTLPSITHRKD